MPFIPTPNVVQCDLIHLQDNQVVENRLHFATNIGITADTINSLLAELGSFWESTIMPTMSNEVQFLFIDGLSLETNPGPTGLYVPTGSVYGGLSTPADTNATTLAYSLRTGVSGRSFRGRIFVLGIPKVAVNQNTVSAAHRLVLQAAYSQLIGPDSIATDWELVVVSKRSNNADRPSGLATAVTNGVFVDSTVDSQRRRLPGRGR